MVPNVLKRQWFEETRRILNNNLWNAIEYPTSVEEAMQFWEAFSRNVTSVDDEGTGLTTVVIMSYAVSKLIKLLPCCTNTHIDVALRGPGCHRKRGRKIDDVGHSRRPSDSRQARDSAENGFWKRVGSSGIR